MRSTGEVLGIADSFGLAYYKAQEATRTPLPTSGTVLISVPDQDKPYVLETAREFIKLGFKILATDGTHKFLKRKRGSPPEGSKNWPRAVPISSTCITNGRSTWLSTHRPERAASMTTLVSAKPQLSITFHTLPPRQQPWPAPEASRPTKKNNYTLGSIKSLQEYHADIMNKN